MFVFSVNLDEDGLSSIPEKFYGSLDEVPVSNHGFVRVYPVQFGDSVNNERSLTERLDNELSDYPCPQSNRSSLYYEEKERLDKDLEEYHRSRC